MMSLDDLTTPLTVDQARLSIYSVLGQLGVDTTTWKPGAVVRTMIASVAILVSALSRLTSEIAKSGFLETATGEWLRILALNVYGVTKIDATFATGPALLANSSGGIYVLSDGELQITNQRTGATYVNVGPLTIPGNSSNIPCTLTATEAGNGSTALVTDVMLVSSPLPGVSCALTAALVGLDAESDPSLRLRCSEKLGALSPNGPPDAYGFAARGAKRGDGSVIGVTRVRLTNDGFGNVDVYVADASGAIDPADLSFVDTAIQTQAAPLAVTARIHNAIEVPTAVVCTVYAYNNSGLSIVQIQDAVTSVLVDFFASQPIGGNIIGVSGAVYRNAIIAAIGRAAGAQIFNVTLSTPAADVALSVDQVATLTGATITVQLVPPPGTV